MCTKLILALAELPYLSKQVALHKGRHAQGQISFETIKMQEQ